MGCGYAALCAYTECLQRIVFESMREYLSSLAAEHNKQMLSVSGGVLVIMTVARCPKIATALTASTLQVRQPAELHDLAM